MKGDKVKFANEAKAYTVRCANDRFAICTKPFNAKRTVLYTIIDFQERRRGPENLIFGMGAETDEQCEAMLARLVSGETAVSRRHGIDLDGRAAKIEKAMRMRSPR